MILTEEQIKADNERWKVRDIKQELYYLGYAVPNRLCVTNDNLRFNAFVARKSLEMIEQLSKQSETIRCRDCKQFRRWLDTDICFCDITESERSDDDFCSRAERREAAT